MPWLHQGRNGSERIDGSIRRAELFARIHVDKMLVGKHAFHGERDAHPKRGR
ncbi:MAG: hypothetical protein Q7K57_45830 [Burkholderiaceae bacterium]|nr:hypothetical protein [Burkholderiaceae bacterium]